MIRIKRLDHVVIRAKDAEKLVAFYCRVLGCTVERRLAPDIGIVQLRAGEALVDIVAVESEIGRLGGAAPGHEGHNMDHFCVRLESFDEESIREHLLQHGIEPGNLETRYGSEGYGPSFYIQDPEGNTIELKGPPSSKS